jgi:hypothetical protein
MSRIQKFQNIWITKLPCAKSILSEDGFIARVFSARFA